MFLQGRKRIAAAVALAVVGVAAVIAAWPARERVAASPRASQAARAAGTDATVASPSAPSPAEPKAPAHAGPLPEGTAGQTHAALVQRAEDGDGAAALRLADLMSLCADYVPTPREEAERQLVEGMAVFEPPGSPAQALQQKALISTILEAQDRQREACPGFAELGIADPLAEQRRWTALAARLGEARAVVAMADAMIGKYALAGDIVEHAEELRVLRPQAMALLQQAVGTGEPLALLRMSAAHRTGDLAVRDPLEAYAWMLAYRDGPPSPHMSPAFLELALHQLAAPLDDAQRAQARRRAEAIRRQCCGG